MTNATHTATSPLSSSTAGLSVPELLLLTEALVQLAQQSQQTQQVSLAEVDWTSIASMLSSRYPLGSSSLTPTLLSSQLLAHLSTLSAPSSPSSVPLAALITLSTSLKQQRLQQLKDEYVASTVRQQQLEDQVKSAATTSSSLPTARPDLPVPPMFPAPSAVVYPSTPLLMSPLQRSVSEKSRLPSTPLPPTAASIAHMPPLEESMMSVPEDAVPQQQQAVKEEAAQAVVKRETGANIQVTPPPPLMRTITDMELVRSPESEAVNDEADLTQTHQSVDTAESITADAQLNDPTDTSSSSSSNSTSPTTSTTSPSPTSRTSPATLTATCLEILACLQRHPDADPFRYPVDPTEVPNYYDTIRQPMDFDTIRRQLQQSPPLISTPQQFHERLLLVFQNAYTFNDKKTSFYKMAKNLDAFAADLCRKYWPEEKKSFFASPEARKLTGRQSKGGQVGSGVKELELDTPVGVMVVGVVSAPSSPSDKDGSGGSGGSTGGGGEDEVGGVVEEADAGGRKAGRGGRGGVSSVASTPTAAGERMGTRKAMKGSKAEEEAASAAEAEDGKAAGRKKAAQAESAGRGRGGTRRKSDKGETEEEEKVQEETKAQETPKNRRGRGRGRGH